MKKVLSILTAPFIFVFRIAWSFISAFFIFLWELVKLPFTRFSTHKKPTNGYEYEYCVADYLKKRGYNNIEVTKASGDYGADIIARKEKSKYAVQCKYYNSPVGVSAIQEVTAAKAHYGCDKAMVVTNNTFTTAAQKLAGDNDVILLDKITGTASTLSISQRKTLLWILYGIIVAALLSALIYICVTHPLNYSIQYIIGIPIILAIPILVTLIRHKKYRIKRATPIKDVTEKVTPSIDAQALIPYLPLELNSRAATCAQQLAGISDISVINIQRQCKCNYDNACLIVERLKLYKLIDGNKWTKKALLLNTEGQEG